MAELVKFEIVHQENTVFIGKALRCKMSEMAASNPIPAFWHQCFGECIFAPLESQSGFVENDAYVGLMVDYDGGDDFSYVVGMFMKPGATAPEGYFSRELDSCDVAIGWVKGVEAEVYQYTHQFTEEALRNAGRTPATGEKSWCAEVYNCSRFTEPDSDGKLILDYYIPLC